VLGATGSVGQRFVSLLDKHPWFELTTVAASAKNAGRPYGEAARWDLDHPLPESTAALVLTDATSPVVERLVFSALDAEVAGEIEAACAAAGALVVSNASSHRMDRDVPLLVPEVNPEHLDLLELQTWKGGLITNPNCSTIGLVLALAPLHRAFGVRRVHVVTMQALSGAGSTGVPAMAALDNLIPYIQGEEEKLATETARILGRLSDGAVHPAPITVSAQCNRVAVLDGHTECVSIELDTPATRDEILAAWEGFRGAPQELDLPSAPAHPTLYLDAPDAPQPRLHRDLEAGMACILGRLQPCPVLGWRFVCLSHNTLRGAAGGALLAAELAVASGSSPLALPMPQL